MSDPRTHENVFGQSTTRLIEELESAPEFSGRLSADKVEEILQLEDKSVEQILVGLLPKAAARAYAPISNFCVGAVSLGKSGCIYFGCNIEIPHQACGFAVHAEQSAFTNAFLHGERELKATAVSAAPCGHCRQFMSEFSLDLDLQIIFKDTVSTTLAKLLPESFGPRHLGNTRGIPHWSDYALNILGTTDGAQTELTRAALSAAQTSYAPYSNSPSGVALSTKKGRIHTGSYIENAAFNPSLPPLQAALVSLIQCGESPEDIVDCLLVELKHARITQEDSARAVLRGINPQSSMQLVHAQIVGSPRV